VVDRRARGFLSHQVKIGDLTFGWSGSLASLEDREAIPEPPDLKTAFQKMAFAYRCSLPDKIGHYLEKGYVPLFLTDGKQWKRHVKCADAPDQVVMVRPLEPATK
jgi:hypothetical protein